MPEPLVVDLAGRSYPIHFLDGGAADLGVLRARAGLAAPEPPGGPVVVADENFHRAHPGLLSDWGERLCLIPSGEASKSLAAYERVLDFLAARRVRRDGCVIVAGGGVVGDLGGFAAATWLRGIDFVQVPTTLLAMVDSSVGGKTGINLRAGKNLVGAFHQPRSVIIAPAWLHSLPGREFAAGMGEVIKYGLLGDAALFDRLEAAPLRAGSADLADVIRTCCALKAGIVAADERETAAEGGRALLNLGHTFAHAIEAVAGYGAYLHGEAVAIGLHAAALLSERLGCLAASDVTRVVAVLEAHALPARLLQPLPVPDLMAAMAQDKKNRADGIRFVVLRRLGEAATQSRIPPPLAGEVWRSVGAR